MSRCLLCLESQLELKSMNNYFINCYCKENIFHAQCWIKYITFQKTCPICRQPVKTVSTLVKRYYIVINLLIIFPCILFVIGMKIELTNNLYDNRLFGLCLICIIITLFIGLELTFLLERSSIEKIDTIYFWSIFILSQISLWSGIVSIKHLCIFTGMIMLSSYSMIIGSLISFSKNLF